MTRSSSLFFLSFLVGFICIIPNVAFAQTAAEIQAQIDANNKQITELQAEIATYQKQLDTLGAKKDTLQSAISSLTLSQKQLASNIKITQSKISSANLKIQSLSSSIRGKESSIAENQVVIAKTLRSVAESERSPLVVKLISSNSLKEAWQIADAAAQFDQALVARTNDLRILRNELSSNRDRVAEEKASLVSLENDLARQKRSVDANKTAQQKLLTDTKNQE